MRRLPLSILMILAASGPNACQSTAMAPNSASSWESSQTTNDLTPRERQDWADLHERMPSPCGPTPLVSCAANTCPACGYARRFLAQSLRAGHATRQVETRYTARFLAPKIEISTEGAPSKGPVEAPVTIIEFADFQCPSCAGAVPILDGIIKTYAPHVRLIFKHFPIEHHPRARAAAGAAQAAHLQGKFWDMHHVLFQQPDGLDDADFDHYARQLNLNLTLFQADRASPSVMAVVDAHQASGRAAMLQGTPAIYINGRPFDLALFDFGGQDLSDWIESEIEIVRGRPQ